MGKTLIGGAEEFIFNRAIFDSDIYKYVVTMYRRGEKERHSYVLGVYDSEVDAISEAHKERTNRGWQKYIPEVLKVKLNESKNCEVILKIEDG